MSWIGYYKIEAHRKAVEKQLFEEFSENAKGGGEDARASTQAYSSRLTDKQLKTVVRRFNKKVEKSEHVYLNSIIKDYISTNKLEI